MGWGVTMHSSDDHSNNSDQGALQKAPDGSPVVQMSDVHMRFGGVTALSGVHFEARRGEIHALLGENGAGKSTLAKILAGAVQPTSGTVVVEGAPIEAKPIAAIRAGVRMITQEISLFPPLSVAENLVTGGAGHPNRVIRWRSVKERAQRFLEMIGLHVEVSAPLFSLSIGEQQLVEIARALFSGGRVVILDEPTSALGTRDTQRLFSFVTRMAASGTSFILITHFLDDVMNHAHRATVLRNSKVAATCDIATSRKADLVRHMVGSDQRLSSAASGEGVRLKSPPQGSPTLAVNAVAAPPTVRDMSLTVHPGEVVGVFGDVASGCMELGELVMAVRKVLSGSVAIDGKTPRSPEHAVRTLGVGYIPADRRSALALHQSASANVTAALLHKFFRIRVSSRMERRLTQDQLTRLAVKSCATTTLPATLSGGNQQKLLFARWLLSPPRLLVLVEPTRGMDIKAKGDIVEIIRDTVAGGDVAVLVVSAEPDTLLSMSDRIYVTQQGGVVAQFAECTVTAQTLMAAAHADAGDSQEGAA